MRQDQNAQKALAWWQAAVAALRPEIEDMVSASRWREVLIGREGGGAVGGKAPMGASSPPDSEDGSDDELAGELEDELGGAGEDEEDE